METPFAFRTPGGMSCVPHRGGRDKRLFLLNHFITIDDGSRLDAGTVDARQYVLDRVHRCERERGRPVNFAAVDHTTISDAGGAVVELNADRGGAPGYRPNSSNATAGFPPNRSPVAVAPFVRNSRT
jgi:hypothetical protein